MCWQVKLPFLDEVFPRDTPKFPGTFLFLATSCMCICRGGQGRGSCDRPGTSDHQKGEEKRLLGGMSPLNKLLPGPLPQFVSHPRPAARRGQEPWGWPCSTLEVGPPLPAAWPGLDPPAVTTARASSPVLPCLSVKGKGLVPSRREVSGCSWRHTSTAVQGALPGRARWEQMM